MGGKNPPRKRQAGAKAPLPKHDDDKGSYMLATINKLLDRPNLGKFVLRVSFALLMLPHGFNKLANGTAGVEKMLAAQGMPAFLAYGVFITEIVAPVLMILGVWTRLSALVFSSGMVTAAYLSGKNIWGATSVGAWNHEATAVFFFAGIAVMLLGSGKAAIRPD